MAFKIEHISGWPQVFVKSKNRWLTARPIIGPLWWRMKDAWGVITGKYDAIEFVSESETGKEE